MASEPARSRIADALRRGAARAYAEARPLPPRYRRAMGMRVRDWLRDYLEEVEGQRRWMGVPALKNPLDAWVYQEIVCELRPQAVVELGSAYGGSTLFFCHLLDLLGIEGEVISVDFVHLESERARFLAEHERIVKVGGDTRDPEVIEQVRARCAGRRTLIVHDASHIGSVVLEDLRNYSPLVTPGSYFIVEDGVADLIRPRRGGPVNPGPMWAVRRFLRESDAFEVDLERERHLITYNPQGFLRRRQND
ncbi:MAG: CmcI family methyltransferase [Solirubrobacterales bacterium]